MSSTSTRLPAPEGPCFGHLLAEQAPELMLTAPTRFVDPYRESRGDSR
jgi:hypothetical protein